MFSLRYYYILPDQPPHRPTAFYVETDTAVVGQKSKNTLHLEAGTAAFCGVHCSTTGFLPEQPLTTG